MTNRWLCYNYNVSGCLMNNHIQFLTYKLDYMTTKHLVDVRGSRVKAKVPFKTGLTTPKDHTMLIKYAFQETPNPMLCGLHLIHFTSSQ